MPGTALRNRLANVVRRVSHGSRRKSIPSSSSRSKAYRNALRARFRPTAARRSSKSETPSDPHTTPSPSMVTDFNRKGCKRLGNHRHFFRPIMATAAEHTQAFTNAPADEPEAVVFDFVDPLRASWHGVAIRRQAGLDETGGRRTGPEECERQCIQVD